MPAQVSYRDSYYVICEAVAQALAPFRPGSMVLYVEDRWYAGRFVRLELNAYPDHDFIIEPEELYKLTFNSPSGNQLDAVAAAAAKHYRNIPALSVDDNVVLGYN